MSRWYLSPAENNDIVISSRIRIARNLTGMPFPVRMSAQDRQSLNERVKNAVATINDPAISSLKFIELAKVPKLEIAAMVERHVISADFAAKGENSAILLNEDETVCVMIGEEDHIRIQVVLGGLNLESAYNIAYKIERLLDSALHFAFDERLGYLTACPTNLGTGLRAGVMLHLPILEAENSVANLSESIRKIGFTVRGIYGEGSSSKASMYQISNQITLGIDEKTAIDNLSVITKQIIEQEKQRREAFNKIKLEDIAWRAYGNLKFARVLSSEEMFREVSKIKLGIGMGIIECEETLPMKILIETQPNMLMCRFGNMAPDERDIKRAEMVRAMLK